MTPVIPCSIGNLSLFPRLTTYSSRKENRLTKCKLFGKSTIPSLAILPLPQSMPIRLFLKYKSDSVIDYRTRTQIVATARTDVAIEDPNSAIEGEDVDKTSDAPSTSAETSEASSSRNAAVTPISQSKRPKPVRKSEMPPVKNEELVPGATFTGKVRSIQPFGAFIDFGAFTDGLVHVSQLSDSFVKDVGSFVSIGQEVKVRLLEANFETGRVSLTMREGEDINKLQQRKDALATGTSDKPKSTRRNAGKSNQKRDEVQESSKFVRGQNLDGTVKNLTRAGAFISLPEGGEGFLPTAEESEAGDIMGSSSLQVGQEVKVRVLRMTRGQITLTMKNEENTAKLMKDLNLKLNQGVVHVATNPFELAFRRNETIGTFLEEREKVKKSAAFSAPPKTSEQIEGKADTTKTEFDIPVVEDLPSSNKENQVNTSSELSDSLQLDGSVTETMGEDELIPKSSTSASTVINGDVKTDVVEDESNETNTAGEVGDGVSSLETVAIGTVTNEDTKPDVVGEESNETNSAGEVGDGVSSLETVAIGTVTNEDTKPDVVGEESNETNSAGEVGVDDTLIDDNKVVTEEPLIAENKLSSDATNVVLDEVSVTDQAKEGSKKTDSPGEMVDQISSSESEDDKEVLVSEEDKVEKEGVPVIENEMPPTKPAEDAKELPSIPEQNGSVTSNEQEKIPSPQGSTTKAIVSPALVKHLREETGAGMMDCKRALAETGGDIIKAQEFLRKKGLASAEKKASRATAEGRIGSYVHDSRIGILIEVNCETDFVSRGDIFKQLVDDLAMQVAACPQVQYLVTEDVPEETVNKEREIEMQKEDLLKKPEQIRSKIVEGRIRKRLEEFALLEQPYIKNDKVVVKDWVKQTIATIGENIKVKRFVRYNLGEGLEKKSQDFAAEVAAQTSARPPPAAPKDQSASEAVETVKPPTISVSAALVKQLREETGAGMMDCKKALAETGGDLEKAQEYLRKKGLSAADKKSSRLAAEGRIASYIHDSRIGVLIEVNCETDFVARGENFKELVDDLAMQVAACPQVQFVSMDEIPESIVTKERELEMQREDLKSKPENIREKIVEGRVSKRLGEFALLEQPFIKNDSVLVKDLVKQTVSALGENIKVRRFVRFTLGETIESEKPAVEA